MITIESIVYKTLKGLLKQVVYFFHHLWMVCEMQHTMSQSPYYWVYATTKMNLNMFVDAINNIKLDLTLTPMKCGKKVKQVDLIQFVLLHNYFAL
jgi:hypothetical protein